MRVFRSADAAVLAPWCTPVARHDLRHLTVYGYTLGWMYLPFDMSLRTRPFGIAVTMQFVGPLTVPMWSSHQLLDFA